jgi:hypothetical protein
MVAFGATEAELLPQLVAEQLPIFVLGPGFFRVGFDDPDDEGWQKIERSVAAVLARLDQVERTFLESFFFSKLSDERRAEPASKARLAELTAAATESWKGEQEELASMSGADGSKAVAAATSFEPWRTLLATELLRAFRHASCCLGLVIGSGESPVVHWQNAHVPAEKIAAWLQERDDGASSNSPGHHLRASSQAILSAMGVARALGRLRNGLRPQDPDMSALLGLPLTGLDLSTSVPQPLVQALRAPLGVLLPEQMAPKLQVLNAMCFSPGGQPLRGANVEWLGDLLWHVLSSDAEVQPSQADLAFYVTLSGTGVPSSPHELRRSAFGDRTAGHHDVKRLTLRSQPDPDPDRGPDSGTRAELLHTIAACLLAQYDLVDYARSILKAARARPAPGPDESWYTDDELPYQNVMDTTVLALVADYGDKLERALFRLLGKDAVFHVAVPVWLSTATTRDLDWLVLDVRQDRDGNAEGRWSWVSEVEQLLGPLVIKLNGCDRPPLGLPRLQGPVSTSPLVSAPERHGNAAIELAVLYDEHDRLTAMQSFDELVTKGKPGLASRLSSNGKGLTWPGRHWLMMGQRFADWIPRLRLFTHKWIGSNDKEQLPPTSHWAIDRTFDWPERSLLESLEITMIQEDLRTVINILAPDAFRARATSPVGERFAETFEGLGKRRRR